MQGPPIARGATAEIFACGDTYVLKLFNAGHHLNQARYEAHVGALIRAAGVPAPAVFALTEVDGRGGVLYERVGGASMDTLLLRGPWRAVPLARRLAATHAALHRARAPGLPVMRVSLARRIRETEPLSDRVRERALTALERLPSGAALCHGDFHPGNLLLSPHGPVVIDWENATLGNPHADVARTLLLLRHAHLHQPPGAARIALRAVLVPFNAVYLRRYCRLTGASPADIERWQLPVAAVRLSEGIPDDVRAALLALVQRLAR